MRTSLGSFGNLNNDFVPIKPVKSQEPDQLGITTNQRKGKKE